MGKTIALLAEEGDDISNLSVPSESSGSESPAKDKDAQTKSKTPDEEDAQPLVSSSHTTSSSSTATPTQASSGSGESSQGHEVSKHKRPLPPSVHRLLMENGSPDISDLKGSGIRGQLTKGDILMFLGKVNNPLGTASKLEAYNQNMDKPKDENMKKLKGSIAKTSKDTAQPSERLLTGMEFRRWITAGMAEQPKMNTAPLSLLGFDDILEGYLPEGPQSQLEAAPPKLLSSRNDPWSELLDM